MSGKKIASVACPSITCTHALCKTLCKHCMLCAQPLSHVRLFETPWTVVTHQAPLSMEFSRQEYWSGLLFPTSGDLPVQGSNLPLLRFLHWQADSLD